jgi:MYXO-CTERM domain-containing protein
VTVNFQGYSTDVAVNNVLVPGAIPVSVDRSANGRVVGWDYTGGPGIGAGGNSSLLVVHTDALQHVAVQNSVINGSVAVVASFGPIPIPEPAALGLAGLAAFGMIRRRK